MRNLKYVVHLKDMSEGHTISKWQSQDSNPERVAPESTQLTVV